MGDPAPTLVDRFRSDFVAIAAGMPERLGIAVSGGPDSLALLLLAHAAWPDRIVAATVDHRMRPESAGEAAFVAELCARLSIPHRILTGDLAGASSVQAEARALRYRLLQDWATNAGCSHLATAHHADDQAETMLMRLARGSGLPGLAGIRATRRLGPLALARPLLGWRREELVAIVADAGIAAVDDPSNRSTRYDRTRFRALLAETEELPALRLARAAANLSECEEALHWAAEAVWSEHVRTEGLVCLFNPAGLPREIRRRIARRAIENVRRAGALSHAWREDGLDRLLDTLDTGARATLADVLCTGGAVWRFEPAPPRNPSGSATVQPNMR